MEFVRHRVEGLRLLPSTEISPCDISRLSLVVFVSKSPNRVTCPLTYLFRFKVVFSFSFTHFPAYKDLDVVCQLTIPFLLTHQSVDVVVIVAIASFFSIDSLIMHFLPLLFAIICLNLIAFPLLILIFQPDLGIQLLVLNVTG